MVAKEDVVRLLDLQCSSVPELRAARYGVQYNLKGIIDGEEQKHLYGFKQEILDMLKELQPVVNSVCEMDKKDAGFVAVCENAVNLYKDFKRYIRRCNYNVLEGPDELPTYGIFGALEEDLKEMDIVTRQFAKDFDAMYQLDWTNPRTRFVFRSRFNALTGTDLSSAMYLIKTSDLKLMRDMTASYRRSCNMHIHGGVITMDMVDHFEDIIELHGMIQDRSYDVVRDHNIDITGTAVLDMMTSQAEKTRYRERLDAYKKKLDSEFENINFLFSGKSYQDWQKFLGDLVGVNGKPPKYPFITDMWYAMYVVYDYIEAAYSPYEDYGIDSNALYDVVSKGLYRVTEMYKELGIKALSYYDVRTPEEKEKYNLANATGTNASAATKTSIFS